MKTEEGIVIEGEGSVVKVKVGRHNDCNNCGACPGNSMVVLDVQNPIGAKPGQRVTFEVKETNAVKGAFIVFMLPLIAVFIGAFIGGKIASSISLGLVPCQIAGAIIAFILVLVYIKIYEKNTKNNKNSLPIISKIK